MKVFPTVTLLMAAFVAATTPWIIFMAGFGRLPMWSVSVAFPVHLAWCGLVAVTAARLTSPRATARKGGAI